MKKIFILLTLFSTSAFAQKKTCPIYATAYTDCQTGITQLNASGGFASYSWTPAAPLSNATIANPTTTTLGLYTVTGYNYGPEQVINPDFSAGNTGFFSALNYSSVYTPGNYFVGPGWFSSVLNPAFPDHTSTADNMFMSIDGASPAKVIWEENMTVSASSNYAFSFHASRADLVQPNFEIHFIGNVTGDVVVGTQLGIPYTGVWTWDQYGIASWSSGANTSVTVRIINLQTAGGGNDFAMDDFSFRKITCSASYTVNATTALGMNLFINGDFSGGNVGFWSGQTYSTVYTPCNYYVGPGWFSPIYNAAFPDHTPTTDNMFMSVDGCAPATVLWEETVPVQNNAIYNFEFWASRADLVQPTFEIHFIGNVTGDVVMGVQTGIPYTGIWTWDQYGTLCWDAQLNTSVTVRIVNLQTAGGGNDFGMDDFSFRQCCNPNQCCGPNPNRMGHVDSETAVDFGFDIFPNPSNGVFQIQLSGNSVAAQAELFNLMGERIDAFTVTGKTYAYAPKQALAAGVYLLRITSNGTVTSKQIIVQ